MSRTFIPAFFARTVFPLYLGSFLPEYCHASHPARRSDSSQETRRPGFRRSYPSRQRPSTAQVSVSLQVSRATKLTPTLLLRSRLEVTTEYRHVAVTLYFVVGLLCWRHFGANLYLDAVNDHFSFSLSCRFLDYLLNPLSHFCL